MKTLNIYIDHTLLQPTATPEEVQQLCEEARAHDFYAVCVNGAYTAFAKANLKNTNVKVASVVGFPLGAMSTAAKVFETEDAIQNGADEIDMVLNIGALKAGDYIRVSEDIKAVRQAAKDVVLKVIFENCYLTNVEIRMACQLCLDAEVDFIKTSTGFGTGGASLDDVKLMKAAVGNKLKIKASGGIRDQATALEYIDLGVARIGTSSGLKIIQ